MTDFISPKEWREREGLTQEEVAEFVGCSDSMVSLLERGIRKPSFRILQNYTSASKGLVTQQSFGGVQ